MATSSIFANVAINDPKMAERFVDALDSANRIHETVSPVPVKRSIMSKEELRDLLRRSTSSRESIQNATTKVEAETLNLLPTVGMETENPFLLQSYNINF